MDPILKKIEKLTDATKIFAGLNEENVDLANTVLSASRDIRSDMNELTQMLNEQKANIDKMKKQIEQLDNLNNYLDHIENNLPDFSEDAQDTFIEDDPQLQTEQNNKVPVCHNTASNKNQARTSGTTLQNGGKKISSRVPEVQHISDTELNSVHGYMRGRLTAENINAFVDVLNTVLKKKYDILKLPRSKLKNCDLDLYGKWKMSEKSAALDPGSYFCTAEDFMKLASYKLDKSAFSKIVILRHFKFIKEVRSGSETLYVIM